MGFDNTFEVNPPSGVPSGPALAVNTNTGALYVATPKLGTWTQASGSAVTSSTVTNLSSVAGATVTAALNTLAGGTTSSQVTNLSGVSGATVTNALNTLNSGGGGLVLPPTSLFVPGLGTNWTQADYYPNAVSIANGVAAFLFVNPYTLNIKQLYCAITTQHPPLSAWLGFYDINGNRLYTTGALAMSSTAFTIPVTWTLTPGTYYFAFASNDVGALSNVVCLNMGSSFNDDHNDHGAEGRGNGAMGSAGNPITSGDLPLTLGLPLGPLDCPIPFLLCGM